MSDVYSEFLKNKYDPNDFYETGIAPQTANYGSIGSALPVTGNRTSKLSVSIFLVINNSIIH